MKKRFVKKNLFTIAGIVIILCLSANKTGDPGVTVLKNPMEGLVAPTSFPYSVAL